MSIPGATAWQCVASLWLCISSPQVVIAEQTFTVGSCAGLFKEVDVNDARAATQVSGWYE